jgi:hypothetical protein
LVRRSCGAGSCRVMQGSACISAESARKNSLVEEEMQAEQAMQASCITPHIREGIYRELLD